MRHEVLKLNKILANVDYTKYYLIVLLPADDYNTVKSSALTQPSYKESPVEGAWEDLEVAFPNPFHPGDIIFIAEGADLIQFVIGERQLPLTLPSKKDTVN